MGTIHDPDSHIHIPNMIDDGLPQLNPLCDLQSLLASHYASVIAHACKLSVPVGAQAQSLDLIKTRLIKDALWAVSEVSRSDEFKIRRQRYLSQGVYDLWTGLVREGVTKVGALMKDADGKSLVHEHVVQRKGIEARLINLTDEAAIKHELCQVTACVVTKAEHKLLDVHNKSKDLQEEPDSWDRYANAQIRVYDRLEKQWLPSNFSARALEI